jgi:hypothetical protein
MTEHLIVILLSCIGVIFGFMLGGPPKPNKQNRAPKTPPLPNPKPIHVKILNGYFVEMPVYEGKCINLNEVLNNGEPIIIK